MINLRFVICLIAVAVLSTSCASNPSASQQPAQVAQNGAGDAMASDRNSTAQPKADDPSPVVPPANAQWTIHVTAIGGADHVQRAMTLKQQLAKGTKLRQWYVIHSEQQSDIYHGYYPDNDANTKEGARAHADLKAIREMADSAGNHPFRMAVFVEPEVPNPDAPAEWDLANAKGAWSLQVAAYRGSTDRKKFAVDAVREFRSRGYEAYYFHGPSTSSVCIGTWPQEAVRTPEETIRTKDPRQPIVVTDRDLPEQGANVVLRGNQRAKAFSSKTEVMDPSLLAMMKEFPHHYVNGMQMNRKHRDKKGQTVSAPDPSFIVPIPRNTPSVLSGQVVDAEPPAGGAVVSPGQPQQPGMGRLRSIGE